MPKFALKRYWRIAMMGLLVALLFFAAYRADFWDGYNRESILRVAILVCVAVTAGWMGRMIYNLNVRYERAGGELEQIFNRSRNGMLVIDRYHRILKGNDAFFAMFGIPGDERARIIKNKVRCQDVPATSFCSSSNCPTTKVFEGAEYAEREMRLSGQGGVEMTCVVSASPLRKDSRGVERVLIDFRNITERIENANKFEQYRKQLRMMASELSLAEERERRRLAVSLHDSVSQALFVSKMELSEMVTNEAFRNDVRSIENLRGTIDKALTETRSLIFELSPPILYEFGLEHAVEWLCEQMSEKHGLPIEFRYENPTEKKMDIEVKVLMFQVIRELLNNVIKHAKASNVAVTLKPGNQYVRCVVKDDGKGFDVSRLRDHSEGNAGFGLFYIKERLNHFEGNLILESEPGSGTCATVIAPFEICKRAASGGTVI